MNQLKTEHSHKNLKTCLEDASIIGLQDTRLLKDNKMLVYSFLYITRIIQVMFAVQ